jgi:hypothetical protein
LLAPIYIYVKILLCFLYHVCQKSHSLSLDRWSSLLTSFDISASANHNRQLGHFNEPAGKFGHSFPEAGIQTELESGS